MLYYILIVKHVLKNIKRCDLQHLKKNLQ
jgi:hypothetical protein